jgi:hypothetical protein
MRIWRAVFIAVFGLALGTGVLGAQGATTPVTATVLSPISVTGTDLDFGNVTAGVSKTVPPISAAAGTFTINALANTAVQFSFTLPTNLTNGVNTMPIGSWDGRYNTNNSQPSATPYTPSGSTQNATISAAGKLHIWIGATVTPAVGQVGGTYSGSIVINVVYQ